MRLIVEPLERCDSFPSPVVVVIDALDECKDQKPVSTLLDILRQHIEQLRQLKFFITSRPEPHIEAVLTGDLQRETTSITFHDIETVKVDVDIILFIRTALASDAKAYRDLIREGWPSEKDVFRLVKRSAYLIVFASTVTRAVFDDECEDLRNGSQRSFGLRRPLHLCPVNSLDQLDNLYMRTLQTTSSNQSRPEATDRLQKVLGAVLTIAHLLSPAHLESLLGLAECP